MCVQLFSHTNYIHMPLYNPYNLEVAQQLGKIYQEKINHEDLYNDNLAGGSGFAAGYHLDSGYEPTLGATSTTQPVKNVDDSELSREIGGAKKKYTRKPKGKGISAGGISGGEKTASGISGGKKTAKGISAGGISGGKKTAKGISAGGISGGNECGSGISGGKPKRKARKKGGDFNDILDGVSKVANTAKDVAEAVAPVAGVVAPLLALGKPKRKPRKKGGANLEYPSTEPYNKNGDPDVPTAPLAKHAPSANKATVLTEPVEKSQMPGVGVGGGKKRVISEKMKRRNELIKKIMRERNCSLPKASKIIAEEKMEY
jgi:hypothetical protein